MLMLYIQFSSLSAHNSINMQSELEHSNQVLPNHYTDLERFFGCL